VSLAVAAPGPLAGAAPQHPPSGGLGGCRIVVTRPRAQAIALSERLRALGAVPVWFPTIDIEPLADHAALDAALARLAEFDLVVFVSANAVACAWARLARVWPATLAAGATGPGTAAALAERGVARVIVPPAQFDSEGLIAELERLGNQPARVLILKGEGGREWLADTLRARGAQVECVASYRRAPGHADPRVIGELAREGQLGGTVVASSEGGDHLMELLGPHALEWLNRAPVFVPHARIAQRMRAHGLTQVVLTGGGDAGLVAGIEAYFAAAGAAACAVPLNCASNPAAAALAATAASATATSATAASATAEFAGPARATAAAATDAAAALTAVSNATAPAGVATAPGAPATIKGRQ